MKDDTLYLVHISDCVARIRAYTKAGHEAFFSSHETQDAVIRNLEVIGEAVKRVSDVTRAKHPDIPWRRVAGLRDILIHEYMNVDLHEVWNIVERDIPILERVVAAIISERGED